MGALIEINTDGLAKLGETICYSLGLTAYGRKKMANAESYAAIKQAETDTQVQLLKLKGEEEVANYILAKETRKINNTKSVIEKATSPFVEGEKVSDKPVNTDWTNRFFSIVEDISDETLQDIWGHILAGEVKCPNSFSLRTLDLLRNITKEEAELFVKASKFYIEGDYICTEKFTLSLHETLLLGETGFINILHNNSDKQIKCRLSIKKLSKSGIEILSLVDRPDRTDFYNSLARFFKSEGVSHVFKHEIVEYGETCRYRTAGEELLG